MSSFNLLGLPIIALAEVLKSMIVFDLLELSQISKRMCGLVKLGNTSNYKGDLHLHPYYCLNYNRSLVVFCQKNSRSAGKTLSKRLYNNKEVIVSQDNDSIVYIYDDDLCSAMISMLNHLYQVLGCTLDNLQGLNDLTSEQFIETFDCITSHQKTMGDFLVLQTKQPLGDYIKTVLDKLTPDSLCLDVCPINNPNFEYQFKTAPKKLTIKNASWFTLDHLLKMEEFEKLTAANALFTNQDLDVVFRKWKAGEFPKLKILQIFSLNIRNDTLIGGMMPPIFDEGNPGNEYGFAGFGASTDGCVDVQSDSGVKAKLLVQSDQLRFLLFVSE